jgi:flagellar hook-length control protein FliK
MEQIEDGAANMVKRGSGRIVITLEPPNLGTLNMDVRVHNDAVRMILIADNHDVKQVLHTNLDQLKTALQGQGLNIDRFEVLVQERTYDGNPGFQPGDGALFEEGRGRRDNTKEDNSPIQILPSGGNELNDPSLGVISLFA